MDEVRYQVFVSSTFSDLKEEREKVLQAILQLKAFPAGMELFPAADEDQFEFIKREIESSDYYLVIIAGRYGSIDEAGLSFTEKEYDYARYIGKPVLAFIVKDVGKLIGDRLETSETSRRKLELFTEKAKKGKLVRFFSNPDELKSEVLHSLPSQFNLKPMRGWVRAGQTSREDLQQIATLQGEVLTLRVEVEKLSHVKNSPEEYLSHGADEVSWELDLNLPFDNRWPPERRFTLAATWDDILKTIFASGSSQVTGDDVTRGILKLILDRYPRTEASAIWIDQGRQMVKNYFAMPNLPVVEKLKGEIVRQFNALDLIIEDSETIYRPDPFGSQVKPVTTVIWKLTRKGQQRLAAVCGIRKGSMPTS